MVLTAPVGSLQDEQQMWWLLGVCCFSSCISAASALQLRPHCITTMVCHVLMQVVIIQVDMDWGGNDFVPNV